MRLSPSDMPRREGTVILAQTGIISKSCAVSSSPVSSAVPSVPAVGRFSTSRARQQQQADILWPRPLGGGGDRVIQKIVWDLPAVGMSPSSAVHQTPSLPSTRAIITSSVGDCHEAVKLVAARGCRIRTPRHRVCSKATPS
eukprot:6145682-Prymnesium_polylepis.1